MCLNNQVDKAFMEHMPARYPTDATFELTLRCNLHCKMCLFRHDDSENKMLMHDELSSDEWIDIAKQAAAAGTINILITGGEAMLRPDFCKIWEGIYKIGFITQLYTNATLVNEQIIATLKKYPPHIIGITIYGASEETYESVCGSKKAFHDMLKGSHMLSQLPSQLQFRTTIIKDNFHEIDAIENLIKREFGQAGITTQTQCVLPPVRGGTSLAREVRLDPKDNTQLIFHRGLKKMKDLVGVEHLDMNRIKIEYLSESKDSILQSNNQCQSQKLTLFGCDAGMKSYTISFDGKMRPCQIMEPFALDTKAIGLKKAWDTLPFNIQVPDLNPTCQSCEIATHCNSCPAARYAETGRLDGRGEYQCAIAKETAKLMKPARQINKSYN